MNYKDARAAHYAVIDDVLLKVFSPNPVKMQEYLDGCQDIYPIIAIRDFLDLSIRDNITAHVFSLSQPTAWSDDFPDITTAEKFVDFINERGRERLNMYEKNGGNTRYMDKYGDADMIDAIYFLDHVKTYEIPGLGVNVVLCIDDQL